MRKLLAPTLFLAAILLGWLLWREVGRRVLAESNARIAADSAKTATQRAEASEAEAATLRAERGQWQRATDQATRKVSITTARASGAVRAALDALSDSALALDSLRGLVKAVGAAFVADSLAQAEREAAWIRRAFAYETIIAADSVALRDARKALVDEQVAHALSKKVGRRSFLSRAAPLVTVAGVAWLAGRLGVP